MWSYFRVNDTSPYVIAVRRIIDLFFRRFVNPWLYSDFIYYMTENGKEFRQHMRTAQAFSRNTVHKRRLQRLEGGEEKFVGRKRQFKDFLEILLDARVRTDSYTSQCKKSSNCIFYFWSTIRLAPVQSVATVTHRTWFLTEKRYWWTFKLKNETNCSEIPILILFYSQRFIWGLVSCFSL